jgi:hypothetical protein
MKKEKNLIRVFTGPEASAILLKSRLEEIGVFTLTKNDFSGSFLGVVPPSVDLYINESDLKRAVLLIREFTKENNA